MSPRSKAGCLATIVVAAALSGCSAGRTLKGGMNTMSEAMDLFWSVRAAGELLSGAAGAADETGDSDSARAAGDEPPPAHYGAD